MCVCEEWGEKRDNECRMVKAAVEESRAVQSSQACQVRLGWKRLQGASCGLVVFGDSASDHLGSNAHFTPSYSCDLGKVIGHFMLQFPSL